MPIIYHIATAPTWQAALRDGAYTQSTLDRTLAEEGFIHASSASQATWVANKFYQGVPDLLLLVIDTGKLTVPLRYEEVPGWDVPFPHIYGPLDLDAVTRAVPLTPGPDGTFAIDPGAGHPSLAASRAGERPVLHWRGDDDACRASRLGVPCPDLRPGTSSQGHAPPLPPDPLLHTVFCSRYLRSGDLSPGHVPRGGTARGSTARGAT